VAAGYPPARSKKIVSPEEVLASEPFALPFTKLMCANPRLDQGNALMVMSEEKARALGIPEDRWVYFHGGGDFTDHKSTEDEKDYTEMWAARIAILQAFAQAGIPSGDVKDRIQHFDIYSCFPSVVNNIVNILGMEFHDCAGFTVTGGLSRRGGAGAIYSLSGLAAMYDRIVERGGTGLVYGIGGASSSHSACVLGKERKTIAPGMPHSEELEKTYRAHDAIPRAILDPKPSGTGKIVTYTIVYDNPLRGKKIEPYIVCIVKVGGRQSIANLVGIDPNELAGMNPADVVGRTGRVETDNKGIISFSI